MKGLNNFLQISSIHGLRYLTKQNGILMRLLWLMTVIAFFICATWMIQENVREALDDPIATTTKIVPSSQFPLPTITFSPSDSRPFDKFHVLEQTLNYLPLGCQDNDEECQEKAQVVRKHFSRLLDNMFDNLMMKLSARLYPLTKFTFINHICPQKSLPSFLATDVLERTRQELLDLYKINFLIPQLAPSNNISDGLQFLHEKYNLTNMVDCHEAVRNTSKRTTIFLLSLHISVSLEEHGTFPLGTALKLLAPYAELEQMDEEIQGHFQTVLMKKFPLAINGSMRPLDIKSFELKSIVNSQEEKHVFHSIAERFAAQNGLTKALKSVHSQSMPPIIWTCLMKGNVLPHCLNAAITYSQQGMGISINPGDWDEFFKMELPLRNTLYNYANDNEEMTLFMQNFGPFTTGTLLPYKY